MLVSIDAEMGRQRNSDILPIQVAENWGVIVKSPLQWLERVLGYVERQLQLYLMLQVD